MLFYPKLAFYRYFSYKSHTSYVQESGEKLSLISMTNYRFFVDYIVHYLTANTRHGVHSPFVYQLVDEVIYDFTPRDYEKEIEKLRFSLEHDHRNIQITDLGAGSMLDKSREKRVRDLATHALKPARLAKLIARLASHFKPAKVVELGTCLGITTSYIAKAVPSSTVVTIEGCPQTASIAQENFDKLGLKNTSLHVGNFDELLPKMLEEEDKIDFLFIDGNHRKQATLDYFNLCLSKIHSASILIFDDIYWSKGMKEAWETIKKHPQVTVTIDLFYIGLVFFKKDQKKEHFKIRFR